MDRKLLDILCCPASRKALRVASSDELKAVNRAIESGHLETMDGHQVRTPLAGALVTTDGATLYRLEDGIPVLLADQGMAATELVASHDPA